MKNRALLVSGLLGIIGWSFACSGSVLILPVEDSGTVPPNDSGVVPRDSSTTPSDGGTPPDDASLQPDTSVGQDSGGPLDAGKDAQISKDASVSSDAGTVCYDETMAGYYAFLDPQLHQNKATQSDINAFYTACLGIGATQATCDAYVGTKAAPLHQGIVNCLFPLYNPALTQAAIQTLPSPVLLPLGDSALFVNIGACRALAASAPAGCALGSANFETCTGSACTACSDETSYDACVQQATVDACASLVPGAACDAAVANGVAAADALCGQAGLTFDDYYFKVATAFCGP